jgi:hypothetical protein
MFITLFNSVNQAYTYPETVVESPWEDIAAFLTTKTICSKKEDAQLFNLWQFKTVDYESGRKYIYEEGKKTQKYEEIPGTIRRCKSNATHLWGIILDYDGNKTIAEVQTLLSSFEYVLYTTFRHSKEQNKFRVVIPFTTPISREILPSKEKSVEETFPEVDHASFALSQSFYLHSCADETLAFSIHNRGHFIDPDWFETEVIEEYIPKETISDKEMDSEFQKKYRKAVLNSLSSCKGLGHMDAMSVVTIIKHCGGNFDDYRRIIAFAFHSDTSEHDPETQHLTWDAVDDDIKIGKFKRDTFIEKHGGKPVVIDEVRAEKKKETTLRMNKYLKERL